MREIKFRVFANGEMYAARDIEFDINGIAEIKYGFHENTYWGKRTSNPEFCEVMQFTGLKDKNGVDIYEGDIVVFSRWLNDTGLAPLSKSCGGWDIGAVYFKSGKYVVTDNEQWGTLSYKHLIVVGNIRENPELLEVK